MHSGWLFQITRPRWGSVILENEGLLVQYGLHYCNGTSAFQMETVVLSMGMGAAMSCDVMECTFLSDCEQLVHLLNTSGDLISAEWKVHTEVMEIWTILAQRRD